MAERPPAPSREVLAALTAYRDATPMPKAARARVRARLFETNSVRHTWLWAGVGALAAGLLLWGAFGVSNALHMTTDASATGNQAPMQAPQDSGETAALDSAKPSGPTTRRPRAPEPATEMMTPAPLKKPAALQSPTPVPPASARASSRREAKSAPPTPPEPTPPPRLARRLGVENRLITRTWEHVRSKQYANARQALAEHASEFPSGVLAPERRALKVIVACLEHPESAAQKGDAYAATGHRTLLAKVRSACNQKNRSGVMGHSD